MGIRHQGDGRRRARFCREWTPEDRAFEAAARRRVDESTDRIMAARRRGAVAGAGVALHVVDGVPVVAYYGTELLRAAHWGIESLPARMVATSLGCHREGRSGADSPDPSGIAAGAAAMPGSRSAASAAEPTRGVPARAGRGFGSGSPAMATTQED